MRAALAVLLLSACAPSLQEGGYYGCQSGRCPPNAPYCHSDRVCRSSPETFADGSVDAPWADPYRACTGSCDAGETCHAEAAGSGYCTRSCRLDGECPAYGGARSVCIGGQCLRGCNAGDCPAPLVCSAGRWDDSGPTSLCANVADMHPAGYYASCVSDSSCPHPLSCVAGRCLRPCDAGQPCAPDERCATHPSMPAVRGCLLLCTDDPALCDVMMRAYRATCLDVVGFDPECEPDSWVL